MHYETPGASHEKVFARCDLWKQIWCVMGFQGKSHSTILSTRYTLEWSCVILTTRTSNPLPVTWWFLWWQEGRSCSSGHGKHMCKDTCSVNVYLSVSKTQEFILLEEYVAKLAAWLPLWVSIGIRNQKRGSVI